MAEALALELTEAQRSALTRRDTSDSEAYQLYLRGRFFWNKRSREGFGRGADYFRQAVEKDPAYALAYSGLADSHIGMTFYHFAPPQEAMPQARAAALKALEIDGSLAEAYASLAHVKNNYEWEWAEAERLFRKAIALKPEYATAHQWLGIHYLAPMRLDEAMATSTRSAARPASPVFNAFVGGALYARRYDEAIEEPQTSTPSRLRRAHWYLGLPPEGPAPGGGGRAQKAVTLSGGSPDEGLARCRLRLAGDRASAEQPWPVGEDPHRDPCLGARPADIHAAFGDRERAFRWLDQAASEHAFHLVYLKVWRSSTPRNHPFPALVRRLGMQPQPRAAGLRADNPAPFSECLGLRRPGRLSPRPRGWI